jgi:putative DNA primase/helicase
MSNGFKNTDLFDDIIDVPVNQPTINQDANTLKNADVSEKQIINHEPNTANTTNTEKNTNAIIDLSTAIDPHTTPPETISQDSPSLHDRPCYWCYGDFWTNHDGKQQGAGVWYHSYNKDKYGEVTATIDTWICGEIQVNAIARDKSGRSFGQVLRFKDRLGQWKTWNMPTHLLAAASSDLLKELLDMGLNFNYHKRDKIPAYIASRNPTKTVWTAAQVGWFDGKFVLPDTTIGNESDDVLFQTESMNQQEYITQGTLNEWRDTVAALCTDNPLLMFSVCSAFAGALLKLCNMDGIGFHIFGESSRGKTTGLKLAASVWGHWEKYKRSWKATANGLEGAALLFNDGLLTLDEIGDIDPKELQDALYMLGNGSGKQRANVHGNAKSVKTWRIAVLSNGEKTIEAQLAQKGFTVKAGQLVRLLQIPLFSQYGAFDNLHDCPDARSFADGIVKRATQSYGTAGRDYLEKLTRDTDTLENISQRLDEALKQFGDNLSPQEKRAAKSFALVGIAGELATAYGITGWTQGTATQAALSCFEQWRGYRGEGDTEQQQILNAVSAYLEKYGDARFTCILEDIQLRGERSGYWRYENNVKQWLFTKSGLQEATKGYDLKQVVAVLKSAGCLILDGEGKNTKTASFKNNETNAKRFYFVCINANTTNTLKNAGVSEKQIINHEPNIANTTNTEKNGNVIKFTPSTAVIVDMGIKYDADTDTGVI